MAESYNRLVAIANAWAENNNSIIQTGKKKATRFG